MKKALNILCISLVFFLAACSEIKEIAKENDDQKQEVNNVEFQKENENELTYEVTGKKRSIPAKTININSGLLGFETLTNGDQTIKVTDWMKLEYDEPQKDAKRIGDTLRGTGEYEGVFIVTENYEWNLPPNGIKSHTDLNLYARDSSGATSKEVDSVPLKNKFDVGQTLKAKTREGEEEYRFAFGECINNTLHAIYIYIPAKIYTPELESQLLAVAESWKFEPEK